MTGDIAQNLAQVRARMDAAAARAHRSPDEIVLVAVSKTMPLERVVQAYEAGQRHFGENRVQEAEAKITAWPAGRVTDRPTWRLIGRLQRNKARRAVQLFDAIDSVDSLDLARALDRCAAEAGKIRPILLEVNVAGEVSKGGFAPGEGFAAAVRAIVALPNLRVDGLMTVAPLAGDPETARPVFRALRLLRDGLRRQHPSLPWPHLSMGMSGDFEVAIEEGATLVRLGRALFGARG
jgi:pyridoxal phosphate enzyme (YggS family)